MRASDMTAQRVNLVYEGPYLGTMLWLLITFVASIFIIPAAWATAFLYRRILSHVTFSDGTAAAFRGLAGRVWVWFVFAGALSTAPNLIEGIVYNGDPFSLFFSPTRPEGASQAAYSTATEAQLVASLVVLPVIVYADLVKIRWAIDGIELTNGPDFRFTGRYLPLVGWTLFFIVSAITVIGWAWVATAFLRWFAGNIEGDGVGFEFVGSGWGFLWRALAFLVVLISLTYLFIESLSPVPLILAFIWGLWVSVWLLKWVMRNVVLFKLASSQGTATPDE